MRKVETNYKKMILDRVWQSPDGCWVWTLTRNKTGYGVIRIGGRKGNTVLVHKLAYELYIGEVPKDWDLHHLCANKLCCNPAHIELLSPQEHFLRGNHPYAIAHRNGTCVKGHILVTMKGGRTYCPICSKRRYNERMVKDIEYRHRVQKKQKARYEKWKKKRIEMGVPIRTSAKQLGAMLSKSIPLIQS